MNRTRFLIGALALAGQVHAGMTAGEAFDAGSLFGKDELGKVKGSISDTKAKDPGKGIPNYTETDPASGHYMGGYGSLTGPASTEANDCTSSPAASDPTAHVHGKCEATRMMLKDPGKKSAMFPLDKKLDPLVVTKNKVSADAETYLGSLIAKGDYGACVKKTVKDPDKYETEYCHQFLTRKDQVCHETLTVTVTVIESCVPGTWFSTTNLAWAGGGVVVEVLCDMDAQTKGYIQVKFTPTGLHGGTRSAVLNVPIGNFTNNDKITRNRAGWLNNEEYIQWVYKGDTVTAAVGYSPGPEHGCVTNSDCTYTFDFLDDRWGNQGTAKVGAFELPRTQYIETDNWDDQCAGWKAKVAP